MQNIESDFLSACMLSSENMQVSIEFGVCSWWFTNESDQNLYEMLVDVSTKTEWNKNNSVPVLQSNAVFRKFQDAIEYCQHTPRWAYLTEDFIDSASVLKGSYIAKELCGISASIGDQLSSGEDPYDVAEYVMGKASNYDELLSDDKRQTTESICNDAFDLDMKIINGERVGLPFPYADFQNKTFGVPYRTVTPIAGRDGEGKSRWVTCLVEHWASSGIAGLYYPIEDGRERFATNLAASHGGYDTFSIKNRNSSESFVNHHRESLNRVSKLPIHIIDAAKTAERIVSDIAQYKRKYGIEWIVIDGWKDIIRTKGENSTQQEIHIMNVLKRAAAKYDVSILPIMHLRKIENNIWISKDLIKGASDLTQSSRMAIMFQDSGFPDGLKEKFGIVDESEFIAIDATKVSYGDKSIIALRKNLEQGRFDEVNKVELREPSY